MTFLRLDDGTHWTPSSEVDRLEHACRYGNPEEVVEVRLEIAGCLAELRHLMRRSPTTKDAQRKLAMLRRADQERRKEYVP
jgi:hypothetical protein